MPPRHAYWTILIDQKPTAFRARDRDELVPTFQQLKRTHADVVMRYFARGKLWDSPEQAHWAAKNVRPERERRGRDWRPGGEHKDPRARFKQEQRERNQERRAKRFDARQEREARPDKRRSDARPGAPAAGKPRGADRGNRESRPPRGKSRPPSHASGRSGGSRPPWQRDRRPGKQHPA